MSESNFTPGPWHLAPDGTIRSRAFLQSDMMGDYLGCVVCDLKAGTGSETWPATGRKHAQPEADANARLIAAAPDLLAACLRVMAGVLSMTRDLRFLGPQMQETGVIADVRAAIAKATG